MVSQTSTIVYLLLATSCCWLEAAASNHRKLDFFPLPASLVPDISSFTPPQVGAAVGVGAGIGASIAFTDPAGNCNTQAITSGQGLTAAFGPATATVNGGQSGTAGCAENAAPASVSTSFTNGFVTTTSLGVGDNCLTNTNSNSGSNTVTIGNGAFSSFGGNFGGSSGCLGRRLRFHPM